MIVASSLLLLAIERFLIGGQDYFDRWLSKTEAFHLHSLDQFHPADICIGHQCLWRAIFIREI